MRDVEMTISEFLNFRKCAKLNNQFFNCYILGVDSYKVIANAEFLTNLGF